MGMFDDPAGYAKDTAIQVAINRFYSDIGAVSGLTIDRKARRISAKLTLSGDALPIDVVIDKWEYGDAMNPNRIRVLSLTTSRKWLSAIAIRWLVNRWFNIPADHMGKVKLALD